jgi:processing peptidase subunit beta
MKNFGELEFGEIPEPLKHVKDFKMTQISNGIRVCTEASSSGLAGVGVFVNAGSRNENFDTSGTAFLLERMALQGTDNRSGHQIQQEIENMGGEFRSHTDRELTSFTMKTLSGDFPKAVEILGDIVSSSTFNPQALEA